jgi:hypothetical protein
MRLCGAPSLILVIVTPLLALYGSTRWSWFAAPVAALAVWTLDCTQRREQRTATPPPTLRHPRLARLRDALR